MECARGGEIADGKGMSVIIHHQTEEGRSWRADEATSVTARAGDRDPEGRLGERPCSAALCFWHWARGPVTCAPPCFVDLVFPPGRVGDRLRSVLELFKSFASFPLHKRVHDQCTGDDWKNGGKKMECRLRAFHPVCSVRAWNNEVATVQLTPKKNAAKVWRRRTMMIDPRSEQRKRYVLLRECVRRRDRGKAGAGAVASGRADWFSLLPMPRRCRTWWRASGWS